MVREETGGEHGVGRRFGRTKQQSAHNRSLCCESRLTWRLAGRLVPFRLVPFHFWGAGRTDLFPRENRSVRC